MNAQSRRFSAKSSLMALLLAGGAASAQELVVSTGIDIPQGPGPLVVIGDLAHALPNPVLFFIAPYLDAPHIAINPHGFALLGRDRAAAGQILTNQVDIIDVPAASVTASFSPGAGYTGLGTVAVNPAGSHLLLASGSVSETADGLKLFVVPTPLSATSTASAIVTLPGYVGTAQTHAITFDPDTGRAYVAHNVGITAIDPPYDAGAVAFTITLPPVSGHTGSYAVELSPDKSILLAAYGPGVLHIIHAPFSAASAAEALPIAGALALDGIAFVPDGSKALVVDADGQTAPGAHLYAVSAPYSAGSIVEQLLLPTGLSPDGFEDITISPDGQYAALAGQGYTQDPLIIVRAPFTTAGFTVQAIPLPFLGFPYGATGRGAGTAHFWPQPAALPPQITIDRTTINEGNSGTRPATLVVTLSKPSTQTVSVDYATIDMTAHAGTNYQAASGILTFPPGTVQKTLTVQVIGNLVDEPTDPYFKVLLSNPANANVLQLPGYEIFADGVCVIADDDGPYIATEPPLPDAYVGVPYAFPFAAVNFANTPTWSADITINGLHIDAIGTLIGTPTTPTIPGDARSYFVVHAQTFTQFAARGYHINIRSDRIFVDGFEPGGSAQQAATSMSSPDPLLPRAPDADDPSMASLLPIPPNLTVRE